MCEEVDLGQRVAQDRCEPARAGAPHPPDLSRLPFCTVAWAYLQRRLPFSYNSDDVCRAPTVVTIYHITVQYDVLMASQSAASGKLYRVRKDFTVEQLRWPHEGQTVQVNQLMGLTGNACDAILQETLTQGMAKHYRKLVGSLVVGVILGAAPLVFMISVVPPAGAKSPWGCFELWKVVAPIIIVPVLCVLCSSWLFRPAEA